MGNVLGVEIGGTKLQVGIGSQNGLPQQILRRQVVPDNGAAGIRRQLLKMTDRIISDNGGWEDLSRAGIGFGGPVLSTSGITVKSFQITGWENFPLRKWAEEQWGVPVRVQNDASTAALAEARHGAGRGSTRFVYITIGSGIGGGYMRNGQIDEGQGAGALEIGHTWVPHPVDSEAIELENLCSGWAIGRRAREASTNEKSIMVDFAGNIEAIDAKVVYRAAEEKDLVALKILQETCSGLGVALGNVVNLLHPERLVIGGGVSLMGELFWNRLRTEVHKRMLPLFQSKVEILPAELGEDVVVVGALSL